MCGFVLLASDKHITSQMATDGTTGVDSAGSKSDAGKKKKKKKGSYVIDEMIDFLAQVLQ